MRQGHRDIAVVVEHSLVAYAPLRGAGRCPSAQVPIDRVTPFVDLIKLARLLNRAPIDLGHEDGMRLYDRHLLLELPDEVLLALLYVSVAVHLLVVTTVPAGIDMHGITDVLAFDGMDGIVGIARLEARARHPDDALEAIGSDDIDDGLEIVVQSLRVVLASLLLAPCPLLLAPNIDRLVGKLDGYQPRVLEDRVVPRYDVPDLHQVLLIVIAHLEVEGAHAWRPHHDVLPMMESLHCQRNIKPLHVELEAFGIEVADVCLASCTLSLALCYGIEIVLVVGPDGIEMQTEDVAVGYLEACQHLLEVIEATIESLVVVAPAPSAAVEPGIGRIHHTMQHNMIALVVHQPTPIDMNRRHTLHLCLCHQGCQTHI